MSSFTISDLVCEIKTNISKLNKDEIMIIKNDLDNVFQQRLIEYDNELKNKLKQEEDKVNKELEQLNEQLEQLKTKKKELSDKLNTENKTKLTNSYVEKAKKNIIQTVKYENTTSTLNVPINKNNKLNYTRNNINYNKPYIVICKVRESTHNIPAYMVIESNENKTRLPNKDDMKYIRQYFKKEIMQEIDNIIILNIVISPHPAQLCIIRNINYNNKEINYHWNRYTIEEFNETYYDKNDEKYYNVPILNKEFKRGNIIEPIIKSEKIRDIIGTIADY